MSDDWEPDGFDRDEHMERRDQFNTAAQELLRQLAAEHFPTMYLRGCALALDFIDTSSDSTRVESLAPDGQSPFATIGLYEAAKHLHL